MLIVALALALATPAPPVAPTSPRVRAAVHIDSVARDVAVSASAGFALQSQNETQRRIDDAAALGLRCAGGPAVGSEGAHAGDRTGAPPPARFTRSTVPSTLQSLSEHDCFVKLALLVDADVLIDVRSESRPNGPVVVTRVVDAIAGDVRVHEGLAAPDVLDIGALVAGADVAGAGDDGVLRIDAAPGGDVFVEGKSVGHTPVVMHLPAGRHPLAIVREGYVDVVVDADVAAGRVVDVKAAQATLTAAASARQASAHGVASARAIESASDAQARRVRAGGEEDRWVDAVAVGVGAVAVGAAAIAVGAYAVHLATSSAPNNAAQ